MESTQNDRGSVLSRYFAEIREYPLLTKEEELVLAEDVKQGRNGALGELIESNLSFVVKVASEYRNIGLPFEDLLKWALDFRLREVRRLYPRIRRRCGSIRVL